MQTDIKNLNKQSNRHRKSKQTNKNANQILAIQIVAILTSWHTQTNNL